MQVAGLQPTGMISFSSSHAATAAGCPIGSLGWISKYKVWCGQGPSQECSWSQRCPGREKSSIYGLKDARLIWGCGFSMVVLTSIAARGSSWCPEGRVEAQANKTQGRELPGAGDGQCRWKKGDHTGGSSSTATG